MQRIQHQLAYCATKGESKEQRIYNLAQCSEDKISISDIFNRRTNDEHTNSKDKQRSTKEIPH